MKYTNNLPDYYKMLHIHKNATRAEIKKAFRHRAKEIHPDLGTNSPKRLEAMRELLLAYETLVNTDLRQDYDLHYKLVYTENDFNYREFLQSRYDDPETAGKLIFFDLLHENEKAGLDLYDTLVKEKGFDLSKHLDREDFMDCTFLLAEKYEEEGERTAAFMLLKILITYEIERPYFRHFFQEILDRMRNLLKKAKTLNASQYINVFLQLISLPIPKREKALYMEKVSHLYLQYNDINKAQFFNAEARKLNPRVQRLEYQNSSHSLFNTMKLLHKAKVSD
ncbi:MAG: J domain-containing protein [Salinispira sp.]